MKFLLLMTGILLGTAIGQAAEVKSSPWRFDIFPLNLEMRYERDSSQQMIDRRPLNFAIGLRKSSSTILLEYSSFSESTGNTTLAIDRDHSEYLLWWKENLINFELLDFYVTVGAGGYEEKVSTQLAGAGAVTDSSGLQFVGGGSAGIQSMLAGMVLVNAEARLIAGKNFDPNPQASLLIRIGVEF